MVSEEEIIKVAKLMKINIDDHREFIDKVHTMIDYFDILDSAGVEEDEMITNDISLSELREDKHIPFNENLIEKLYNYKGTFVRAPKMV